MSIQTKQQLAHSRVKLQALEVRLRELDREPVVNVRTRELTKQSLKQIINQLKEEIVRFEAHELSTSA